MADAARAILAKNGDLTVEQFSAALANILGNVLSHPGEDKYHRIKAKAKLVQRTILAADGGLAAFLALGFRKQAVRVAAAPAAVPQTYEQFTTIGTAAAEDSLLQMGFRRSAARHALRECGGDISLALDRLAGHPEFMGIDDPSVEAEARRLEAATRQAAQMRQAASAPPAPTEDVYVLSTVDEAALRAALAVYTTELPAALARKRDERRAAQKARAKTEAQSAAAERAAAQRRWSEDESDRAARRRKLAAPAPAPRDDTGGLIDTQDRDFAAAAAADGATAPASPIVSNAHATLSVCVHLPGAPPARRQFLTSWSLRQLADFISRQLPQDDEARTARLTVAGARQPLVIDDRTLMECNIGGSTLYVEAVIQQVVQQPVVDDDDGYRAALAGAGVAVVDAVDNLAPRTFQTGAAPRRLMRELRALNDDLPQPNSASTILVRYDAEKPAFMRVLITGPPATPYAHGCFEFEIRCPEDYPASPPTVRILTTKRGTAQFGPNLYADGLVCLSLLGTWEGPGWEPAQFSLLQVLVSIQGLVLGMRHPHFNEPGFGGWEGTETDTSRTGRVLSTGGDGGSHVPPEARKMDEILTVQTLDVACAFALETRRESPFAAAILAHFSARTGAIAVTVDAQIAEARAFYPSTAERFATVLRRTLDAFQERLAAAAAKPAAAPPAASAPATAPAASAPATPAPQLPPPALPAAPPAPQANAEEIASLEARLDELRRRAGGGVDAMEESDDDDDMDDAPDGGGYAGAEVFGAGRRLDSTETAPDPAPALAALAEAEALRAAAEVLRRKDVADKRAAFLARLSP
jgi:baculoviral IAP repeat-containing protein 6